MGLKNDLVIRAARGECTERSPVWVMRQAGRILAPYRRIREKAGSFKKLISDPDAAAEVTIQPVDILETDAAIIFSDILVLPEAMGAPYNMEEGKGPWFERPIDTFEAVQKIGTEGIREKLSPTLKAIEKAKEGLDDRVPLIGFAGAPWTIGAYMMEGKATRTFSKARKLLWQEPEMVHQLLDKTTRATITYLKGQVEAGADMVQLFDSWAGILSHKLYNDFGLPYIERICKAIDEVPVIVFSKGGWFARKELGELSCDVIGMDWHMAPRETFELTGRKKTLQGNLDPATLYGDDASVVRETEKMLQDLKGIPHIANLGHGVQPDTDPERVKRFIQTVKEFKTNPV